MTAGFVDFNQAGYGMVKIPESLVSEDEREEIRRYFHDTALYLNREGSGERVQAYRGRKVAGREYVTNLADLDRQWAADQDSWCEELGCCESKRTRRKFKFGRK